MRRALNLILFVSIFLSGVNCAVHRPDPGAISSLHTPRESISFQQAVAVWPAGREREMNLTVGFRTTLQKTEQSPVVLRMAGASLYRVFVNGVFVHYGPARGPHGYYRVDEVDITRFLSKPVNLLAIEVAGYNVSSYYLLDQPSFLQAEVAAGGEVLAATGMHSSAFQAVILSERIQKVERYSIQRTFLEAYQMSPQSEDWREKLEWKDSSVLLKSQGVKRLLPRRVPYPDYSIYIPVGWVYSGVLESKDLPEKPWMGRCAREKCKGYPREELQVIPSLDLQRWRSAKIDGTPGPAENPISLTANTFQIADLGTNRTGFIRAGLMCACPTTLYLVFDEILSEQDVNFKRLNCASVIFLDLQPGEYAFESIEPYTLRYLKLICAKGECRVENITLRDYANPDVHQAEFQSSDPELTELFEAGRETFRQNAVDIFMDCPSRERAGYLCDSFFTSRVALDLSGDVCVEKNFLENFLLPEKFENLPEGMLPMCYPADHPKGLFIPNWAMWFILELQEYNDRSGDGEMVDRFSGRVERLLDYFSRFRNEDGLLENLESWVFIEWSKANKFTQNVNYPSNMLYAGALEAAGALYHRPEWIRQAEQIRQEIRRQSFDGTFFVDNAVRKDGELQVTTNRTEVCQYYAFYFNIADKESHPALWKTLREEFGPRRQAEQTYPEVHPANAFIGNYLRMELLSRDRQTMQLTREMKDLLLFMARRTGTLWENKDERASCNHGFASHAVHVLYRDLLGIYAVNPGAREVHIRFADVPLDWCRGRIPLEEGPVMLSWRKEGGKILYKLQTPAGYSRNIINASGLPVMDESGCDGERNP